MRDREREREREREKYTRRSEKYWRRMRWEIQETAKRGKSATDKGRKSSGFLKQLRRERKGKAEVTGVKCDECKNR